MNPKIGITGSTGFVGKNLVAYLNSEKYDCIPILRNDLYGRIVTSDSSSKKEVIDTCTAIVHLAGKAHDTKQVTNPDEYYLVNTDFAKRQFDMFLASDVPVFIFISSVKATADEVLTVLTEDGIADPKTHYGKSKLLAEQYILSKDIPAYKRVYILRPCMIHGPGNKGNLNLLFNIVNKKIPWPLGSFHNQRSFLSIENLCFVIQNLVVNDTVPSGVYQIADDEPLSTNELIGIISQAIGMRTKIWHIPQWVIRSIAQVGGILYLPLNPERLRKLTESYIVSNKKLLTALNKQLPVNSREGLLKTIRSFVYG